MGDSDDEFDRKKGRDKFRRERNDYDKRNDDRRRDSWEDRRPSGRGGQNSMRSRDSWSGRGGGFRDRRDMYSRPDNYSRPYDDRRRDRYSPGRYDSNPHPAKRMRRDWDEGGYPGGMYDSPFQVSNGPPGNAGWRSMDMSGGGPNDRSPPAFGDRRDVGIDPDCPTQPPMMTFKQFLNKQDDTISQEEAIKSFGDYKLDFKRQQINEFFLAHKEEEWFKLKYHPEEWEKRQVEMRAALKARQKVFDSLVEKKFMEGVMVDIESVDALVKILDATVILLEGGNDFDLTILDNPIEEPEDRSRQNSESAPTAAASSAASATNNDDSEKKDGSENGEDGEIRESDDNKEKELDEEGDAAKSTPPKDLEMDITPEQEELKKKAMEYQKQQEEAAAQMKEQRRKKKSMRKKSDYSYESGSDSGSESDSDSEPAPPGLEDDPGPPGVDDAPTPTTAASAAATPKEKDDAPTDGDDDATNTNTTTSNKEKEGLDDSTEKDKDTTEEAKPKEEEEKEEEDKPRPLHRTNSIFLRNLAPTITKQEVEAVCRRYPGFKRVALQDPQPERRFLRRGWVTFGKECNIKEVCWSLNNIRLRDCELGATLNRELRQRVRGANGLTVHKQVMRNDIKMAAKIIQQLDNKWTLWADEEEEKKDAEKEPQFGFVSKNPVLKNITDYLVDEGSFEEEELIGETDEDKKDANPEITVERDETLCKVVDKMILYLRIVHSVDYYSANEYANEDEMPHRCGIMHARGTPPGATATITQSDVNDWMGSFETKMKPFLDGTQTISNTEAGQIGRKDPDAEVEKFVQANTHELAKDKWLCPLSGKKFKGPDFVRKHIFNKHTEKIEEVKKEVKYFNNYLLDSKRPALPEHPSSRPKPPPPPPQPQPPPPQQPSPQQHTSVLARVGDPYTNRLGGYGAAGYQSPFAVRDSRPPDQYRRGGATGRPFRRSDPRQLIQYTDLDAPEDTDIF